MSFADIKGALNSINDEIAEKANKASIIAVNKFLQEKAVPTIENIFAEAIDAFYGSYSPFYYDRNYSLYDVLEIETINNGDLVGLEYGFNPDLVTPLRNGSSGENGLYDKVFRQGWHGGAIGKGDKKRGDAFTPNYPSYRMPYELYTWWGSPAVIAPISPLEDVNRRIEEYWTGAAEKELQSYWDAAFKDL